jgi:hypothetical protein
VVRTLIELVKVRETFEFFSISDVTFNKIEFSSIIDFGKYPKKPPLRKHPLYVDFHQPNIFPHPTMNVLKLFRFPFTRSLGGSGLVRRLVG